MKTLINSVLGKISTDTLGLTLVHEHLVYGHPGWECDTAAPNYDRKKIADACIDIIKDARRYGLNTIVDATPNDGARDPELYKMVSERTGVNIICATGLYTEEEGAGAYFRMRASVSGNPKQVIQEMYETFSKDIVDGIGNTGVKAGVIKVSTGKDKISAYEEMVLEAAVLTQKDTGVPIISHTEAGTMAPQQAEILLSLGADPKKLMIGHICGNANLEYHLEVLKQGPYISFDRFGLNDIFPDSLRTATVIAMLGMGFENKIMLSHDSVMHWLGRGYPLPSEEQYLIENNIITHIFENIIPALKKANINEKQIQTILVDNPRRLFEGE